MSPSRKMFINAADPEEFRVAIVEEGHTERVCPRVRLPGADQGQYLQGGGGQHRAQPPGGLRQLRRGAPRFPAPVGSPPRLLPGKAQGSAPRSKIQRVLRKGQELIVQVYKEETATKGAYLSTYISLPGRLLVLLAQADPPRDFPQDRKGRRAPSPQRTGPEIGAAPGDGPHRPHRRRGSQDPGSGQGPEVSPEALGRHQPAPPAKPAPCLLYRDLDLITRTVRDYLSSDIKTILVDNLEVLPALAASTPGCPPGRSRP